MPYADPEQARCHAREKRRRNRAAFMEGKVCVRCGSDADLEIHHRDPARKVDHNVWSWSAKRRAEELAKCDVLCAPCHDEHHAKLARSSCGTAAAYDRGCRCPDCTAANTAKMRAYRAARRARGLSARGRPLNDETARRRLAGLEPDAPEGRRITG